MRKVLSIITLAQIRPRLDPRLGVYQSGFRPGRSTSDVVWTKRWIVSIVEHFDIIIKILGLDLSRAFDTIDREKLMEIVEHSDWATPDDLRLIRLLLANTSLQVRVSHYFSAPFQTNIGTPQGDCLSPVLFIIYLDAALREITRAMPNAPSLDNTIGLPFKTAYADDVDIISTSPSHLAVCLDVLEKKLLEWNLILNKSKTEHIELLLFGTASTCPVTRGSEPWRRVRSLGTLLGTPEDIAKRKSQATIALKRLTKAWLRRNFLSEKTRVRLYKAFVLPALTYNIGTQGMTSTLNDKIDAFHRRQLHYVLGIFYPETISNAELYKRTGSVPLSEVARESRWKLFGHILRRPEIPAFQAMTAYFQVAQTDVKKRRGRPRSCLAETLKQDLVITKSKHGFEIHDVKDLHRLKDLALDRTKWARLITEIMG